MSTVGPALPTVAESLRALTVDQLKWYASALPGPKPTRKEELVALLLPLGTDRARVRQLWEQLSAVEQAVIGELVYRLDGRYDTEVLRAKYPESTVPYFPNAYYGYGSGIIITGSSSAQRQETPRAFQLLLRFDYTNGVYLPADLGDLLRTIAPLPPPLALTGQDTPPLELARRADRATPPPVLVSEAERSVFHDLLATLLLVQEGKAVVSATTRQPNLATVRLLRQRLLLAEYLPDEYERAEDAVRPLALVLLVQAVKWAVPDEKGGKLALTKAGQTALAAGLTPAHIRQLWSAWLKTPLLDELSRIRGIKGQGAKGTRLTKPAERRAQIARALHACPPDQWVSLRDFCRYLRAERLSPVIERGYEPQLTVDWYYDYREQGADEGTYWDVIIGTYLRAVLWEYAATLGLIEIAYTHPTENPRSYRPPYGSTQSYFSRYDGLIALRLTALGAYALGLADSYEPPVAPASERPPLMLLPNLDLVIVDAPHLAPNDRAFLERLGVPQSQDVYKLAREQLLDLVESGISLRQIRDFIAARTGLPERDFPQPVRVFLADLDQRLGMLHHSGRLVLLESLDPLLLTELAHDTTLRASVQLATIAGQSALLVPEAQETLVWRRLKQLGYLPQRR